MIVAGPTGVGKSTFVTGMLLERTVDTLFDYINIFIGTAREDNYMVQALKKEFKEKVNIVEVKKIFSEGDFCTELPKLFHNLIRKGKKGCVIFDDLMSELAQCDLLIPLFTKYSSHMNITSIHITQNVFYKGGGKHSGDHTTLYRNTQYLVLFWNPMDSTVVQNVSRRLTTTKCKEITSLLESVMKDHRYVLIDGKMDTPHELRFRSDIFASESGLPYQRVFTTPAEEE